MVKRISSDSIVSLSFIYFSSLPFSNAVLFLPICSQSLLLPFLSSVLISSPFPPLIQLQYLRLGKHFKLSYLGPCGKSVTHAFWVHFELKNGDWMQQFQQSASTFALPRSRQQCVPSQKSKDVVPPQCKSRRLSSIVLTGESVFASSSPNRRAVE